MSELSDQPPRLEEQLREIDRRLRLIRFGLDPAAQVNSHFSAGDSGSPRAGPLSEALQRAHDLGSGLPAGSAPDSEPLAPGGAAAEAAAAELDGRLRALLALQSALGELEARVAEAMSDCRVVLEQVLETAGESPKRAGRAASVLAGPFDTPAEVRAFVKLLDGLDVVEEARVAGFEGEDRAVLEVRLRAGPPR
jgi:hypothetical protein